MKSDSTTETKRDVAHTHRGLNYRQGPRISKTVRSLLIFISAVDPSAKGMTGKEIFTMTGLRFFSDKRL